MNTARKSVNQLQPKDFPRVVILAWRAFDLANKTHFEVASSKTSHLPRDTRAHLIFDTRTTERDAQDALDALLKAYGFKVRETARRLEILQPRTD